MSQSDALKKLIEILRQLMGSGFWGQVTIRFKDGRPTLIQQEQQIKID